MPNPTMAAAANTTAGHFDGLSCADTEALLADAQAEILRLQEENTLLRRRLDNVRAEKAVAVAEAVAAREPVFAD